MDLTAEYDAIWPQGASTPYQLARMRNIERAHGFYPAGGDGVSEWNKQNMMATMQKLAKQRAVLLERVAACDAQLDVLDEGIAHLDALHEEANVVHKQYKKEAKTHMSRIL
jgi:hypothetical protein